MIDHLPAARSRSCLLLAFALAGAVLPAGCGPGYRELRVDGQQFVLSGAYGPARTMFLQADEVSPHRIENLHDLGACSVLLARQQLERRNYAAAMRELDAAIAYYNRAIEVSPAHQASLVGKNIALELMGKFDEALDHAEWAATVVGPSATQFLFLASELEERGDLDGAYLRYRQAVAVEPTNAAAHIAFAEFLLTRNNEQAAIHHLQIAYRLDPVNKKVMAKLAGFGAIPPLGEDRSDKP